MKIYLSHSPAAAAGAQRLGTSLRDAGHEPMGAGAIAAGEDWQKALEQGLQGSDALVFLVDPGAERSPWLQQEWSAALEQSWADPGRPMIPVLVGAAEPPPFLRDRQAIRIEAEEDWQAAATGIVSALEGDAGAPQAAPPEAQRAEQQQRLNENAREVAKLEPTEEDRAAQAQWLEDHVRRIRERDPQSPELAELETRLADLLKSLNRTDDAVAHMQAALPLLVQRPGLERQLARLHTNLGRTLEGAGREQEALRHWEEALALYQALEGPDSLMVAMIHVSLGVLKKKVGDFAGAQAHQEAAVGALRKLVRGAADVLSRNLGGILPALGGLLGGLFGRRGEREGPDQKAPGDKPDKPGDQADPGKEG